MDGWKLVPVEPTEEMAVVFKEAFIQGSIWNGRVEQGYKAMLAAAPTPPVPEVSTELEMECAKSLQAFERLSDIENPAQHAKPDSPGVSMEPFAVLHDDGYFTLKSFGNVFQAGWRKEVYSSEHLTTLQSKITTLDDALDCANDAVDELQAKLEQAEKDKAELLNLVRRSVYLLTSWHKWYGQLNVEAIPPSGDVTFLEDVGEVLAKYEVKK